MSSIVSDVTVNSLPSRPVTVIDAEVTGKRSAFQHQDPHNTVTVLSTAETKTIEVPVVAMTLGETKDARYVQSSHIDPDGVVTANVLREALDIFRFDIHKELQYVIREQVRLFGIMKVFFV